MKLKKLKLNQLAQADLDEQEMCRLLGGGTPGCCQCGCNYASSNGSSTSNNDSANDSYGYTSDAGATTPCDPPTTGGGGSTGGTTTLSSGTECGYYTNPSDNTRIVSPYCSN